MNDNTENAQHPHGQLSNRKKLLWSILFVAIAILTVWAVIGQSKSFSIFGFLSYVRSSFNWYLLLAFLCVLAYIAFEGLALLRICRALSYKRSFGQGMSYSAADIYFSAITPSATGGQPASAYFMVQDGIPVSVVTASLVVNLVMYALSTLVFGLIGVFATPGLFSLFSIPSRALILFGIVMQCLLITFFLLVLKKDVILWRIGLALLTLLRKIKLIRNKEKWEAKLQKTLSSYREVVDTLGGKRKMLVDAFLLNLLQRACLIAVFVFTFLATGGTFLQAGAIWCVESMAFIGSNTIPIPGAMGITDALLLDGFGALMDANAAVNLALFSRAISFYLCVLLCGLATVIRYLQIRFQKSEKQK